MRQSGGGASSSSNGGGSGALADVDNGVDGAPVADAGSREQPASGARPAVNRVGGVAAGDHWVDRGGNECVVTWVRNLGVLAYRRVGDRLKHEKVVDVVRFIQRFRPAHGALAAKHAGGTG